jgi:hypothetical protein
MPLLCEPCTSLAIDPLSRGFEGVLQHFGKLLHANVTELKACATRCEICSLFYDCIWRSSPLEVQHLLTGGAH